MNSPHPPIPFILSVPNEIHHHFFSCLYELSHDEPFVEWHSNGKEYEVSQMLVLRSVCRHFRIITAELDSWYDADFNFIDLIRPVGDGQFRPLYQEEKFLRSLFSDANLVNSLGQRKTAWMFQSLEGLMVVLECVPLFIQNARSIQLEILEGGGCRSTRPPRLDTAIVTLAACSYITELSTRLADTLNLSAIAAAFPSLESLSCPETNEFRGSLEPLGRLRTLRISAWEHAGDQPWLPLRSADALTELYLRYGPDVNIPARDIDRLRI